MRLVTLALALALLSPAAAQTLVADLNPGPAFASPTPVGEVGDRLVFLAWDSAGFGLFATSGEGADRLATAGRGSFQSARLGGALYFFLSDDFDAPLALWKTDGTPGGTVRVADFPDGTTPAGYLTANEDGLFFLARGDNQTQLWTSDGTARGTRQVEGAAPRKNDGLRYIITAERDRVLFSAENGSTLWASGGEGASRLATFGDGSDGSESFFYGTALARGDQSFALVAESDPQGLYSVRGETVDLVAALSPGTSNQTLVPFGDGIFFGAYTPAAPSEIQFYTADASGAQPIGPAFGLGTLDLRTHALVSELTDGSVALAVGGDFNNESSVDIWRVSPEAGAAFAFSLPLGERPVSTSGLFDVARENRLSPAVALAEGVLHAVTSSADGADHSLWRDAGDGTATRLATYLNTERSQQPWLVTAGGQVYVVLETPEAGRELFTLGAVGTPVEPGPAEALALTLQSANPASGETRISIAAPEGEAVVVEVFDALGRRVATLHDGPAPAGDLALRTSGFAPGAYVIRAVARGERASLRIVVAR